MFRYWWPRMELCVFSHRPFYPHILPSACPDPGNVFIWFLGHHILLVFFPPHWWLLSLLGWTLLFFLNWPLKVTVARIYSPQAASHLLTFAYCLGKLVQALGFHGLSCTLWIYLESTESAPAALPSPVTSPIWSIITSCLDYHCSLLTGLPVVALAPFHRASSNSKQAGTGLRVLHLDGAPWCCGALFLSYKVSQHSSQSDLTKLEVRSVSLLSTALLWLPRHPE